MSDPDVKDRKLKEKLFHGIAVYWVYVIYLTLVFATFTQYRRLILADAGLIYTDYGVALIEALIFAKLIMVGDALQLGRRLDQKPLIVPTVVKTMIFTLLVSVFTFIEHAVKGLWKGTGVMQGILDFLGKGSQEVLANCLILFAAFIPFFALREISRLMGGRVDCWPCSSRQEMASSPLSRAALATGGFADNAMASEAGSRSLPCCFELC
jgi:hypothetical protein